ncbi:MAG: hypothetical protein DMG71_01260 [Acidobacteria bacterium]|nr:MAG: hypothetical protein DMG71_01260 [Acidobacteriota bacterium]
MPRIPIFRLGGSGGEGEVPELASYTPALSFEGLQVGIDNLRHDVYLSPKFIESARAQIVRLIAYHGEVESLLAAESRNFASGRRFAGPEDTSTRLRAQPADLKSVLTELLVAALNRAKSQSNLSVDLLARVALVKCLRNELNAQFAQVLERCRLLLRNYEGMRQEKAIEYREHVANFQVRKKIILRKTGQELFLTLREIEKETLIRMRRSLFGDSGELGYKLFLNRLLFTEDGRDDYLSGEHYVMFGNFEKDPDRFSNLQRIACVFLQSLMPGAEDEAALDGWLNVPENAHLLVGNGSPDESSSDGRAQKARLAGWLGLLEDEGVMEYIVASYEVVPLLSEYAPRINAQQLKNALVVRAECDRVEKLIEQHGKLSSASLYAAVGRVVSCRGAERAKVAGRFLRDFMRYHRDLRRLETLNSSLDSVNLIGNEKLRELSAVNDTLYEFLLPQEQKPSEQKTLDHVVIKADIRDSTRLTRLLMERGLNPASYFSLNFYDPVNKLLAKYGATRVFLEGDAIILAILDRTNGPGLELGVGISYQQSPPLYLMDGEQRIMISDALNESDRLSSCNKRARKAMEPLKSPFRVYAFQTVSDADAGENAEDFTMTFNLGGVRMNEGAFSKLQQEISLEPRELELPALWGSEEFRLYSGLVPIGNDIFRQIAVRESRIAQIDPRTFSLIKWTARSYYEVCTDPAIYAMLEDGRAKAAGR